ncbi:MAG: ATP-binding domain-containing protein, partial [Prevotella sp.]|nr:ATP-binding domain-containing protein [Prevotella sp.]
EDGVGRSEETELDFIANGDHAVVCRVRNIHEMHGFRFADVLLRFPDYDDAELQSMVLLDTLQSEAPALTAEQSRQLYDRVLADYADVKPKSKRLKQVMEDVYYSALQVKYGYAVTCHKAQGGQWAHVYVDQGYVTEEMLTPDYIHWLYTAFTRATDRLFLVNWPKSQVEAE